MDGNIKAGLAGATFGLIVSGLMAAAVLSENPHPLAPALAETPPKQRMGVEIDCSGKPHETARGETLVITGQKALHPEIVTLRRGDFKRDVDITGKICSVDAVPLKDGED